MARSSAYGVTLEGDAERSKLAAAVRAFGDTHGRRPRILVAKLGQNGHDRGQKVIASALADLGFDVDVGPHVSTSEDVARQAIENDVHLVGISTPAGEHRVLLPVLVVALRASGATEVKVVCSGAVPAEDHEELLQAGVSAVFAPETPVVSMARRLLELLGALPAEPNG